MQGVHGVCIMFFMRKELLNDSPYGRWSVVSVANEQRLTAPFPPLSPAGKNGVPDIRFKSRWVNGGTSASAFIPSKDKNPSRDGLAAFEPNPEYNL